MENNIIIPKGLLTLQFEGEETSVTISSVSLKELLLNAASTKGSITSSVQHPDKLS